MPALVGGAYTLISFLYRLDAEWISAKKDWQNAQRLAKERRGSVAVPQEHTVEPPDPISNDVVSEPPPELEGEEATSKNKEKPRDSVGYQPEMDEMRCILYAHGGMAPSSREDCRFDVVCPRWLLLRQCGPGTVSLLGACHRPAMPYTTLQLQHSALCS
jgi:hypothetical protein